MDTDLTKYFNTKIVEMEKRIAALESYNQTLTLTYGDITIQSNQLTIDTTSSSWVEYFVFKKDHEQSGVVSFRRYDNAGTQVTDMVFRGYRRTTDSNSNTYITNDIYNSGGTREVFTQLNIAYVSGIFSSSSWRYAASGTSNYSFGVTITDLTNGYGFIETPTAIADPASARNGTIYYNSSTNKLRKKVNGTWSDVG